MTNYALRYLRNKAGWSLAQLQSRTGSEHQISRSYLNRLEHDSNKPSDTTLWRIAAALAQSPALQAEYPNDTENTLFHELKGAVTHLSNGHTVNLTPLDLQSTREQYTYLFNSVTYKARTADNPLNRTQPKQPVSIDKRPKAVLDGTPLTIHESFILARALESIRSERKNEQKNRPAQN